MFILEVLGVAQNKPFCQHNTSIKMDFIHLSLKFQFIL